MAEPSPRFRPLFDRLLVRPDDDWGASEQRTAGGIYVPDVARDLVSHSFNAPAKRGTVVAVGPGRWGGKRNPRERIPVGVGVGAKVLYRHMGGQRDVDIDGGLVILTEDQVMCVDEQAA